MKRKPIKDRDPVLEHAFKGIADLIYSEKRRPGIDPAPDRPQGHKRPRRKTIKLYKDEAAAERGRKGAATRKANAPKRAEQSEHERRSAAAKKGWDKIPPAERKRRAERGWQTRDERYGHPRSKEAIGVSRREKHEAEHNRRYPKYEGRFSRPRYDF